MLLLQQVQAPVYVETIQPIVINWQGVLYILYTVVPATGHEQGFIDTLQWQNNCQPNPANFCQCNDAQT